MISDLQAFVLYTVNYIGVIYNTKICKHIVHSFYTDIDFHEKLAVTDRFLLRLFSVASFRHVTDMQLKKGKVYNEKRKKHPKTNVVIFDVVCHGTE